LMRIHRDGISGIGIMSRLRRQKGALSGGRIRGRRRTLKIAEVLRCDAGRVGKSGSDGGGGVGVAQESPFPVGLSDSVHRRQTRDHIRRHVKEWRCLKSGGRSRCEQRRREKLMLWRLRILPDRGVMRKRVGRIRRQNRRGDGGRKHWVGEMLLRLLLRWRIRINAICSRQVRGSLQVRICRADRSCGRRDMRSGGSGYGVRDRDIRAMGAGSG